MVRFAGLPDGVFRSAKPGRYFATGSETFSLPSSCSIRIATPVTGLVIEAIQNSVSAVIGRFVATSAQPVVSRWRMRSFETTMVTAPATSFFDTISCMAAPTPGSFDSWAMAVSEAANTRTATRIRFMATTCSRSLVRPSRAFAAVPGPGVRR